MQELKVHGDYSGYSIVDREQGKTENKSERGSQSRLALRFTRELSQEPELPTDISKN